MLSFLDELLPILRNAFHGALGDAGWRACDWGWSVGVRGMSDSEERGGDTEVLVTLCGIGPANERWVVQDEEEHTASGPGDSRSLLSSHLQIDGPLPQSANSLSLQRRGGVRGGRGGERSIDGLLFSQPS